ncbi:IclR family transcriptional regulator C-terminal domain-containing protein [Streptomyces sp. NPDC059862]|uniref:IclR family transcriptional regulator domain-containing protein n=1 Tax=Streptomyces sp. NPDC059862 TaxID=3346975 RepID=UPI0036571A6B
MVILQRPSWADRVHPRLLRASGASVGGPRYATSMGRVLPENARKTVETGPLHPLTPHTITGPGALAAPLAKIRSRGCALVDEGQHRRRHQDRPARRGPLHPGADELTGRCAVPGPVSPCSTSGCLCPRSPTVGDRCRWTCRCP